MTKAAARQIVFADLNDTFASNGYSRVGWVYRLEHQDEAILSWTFRYFKLRGEPFGRLELHFCAQYRSLMEPIKVWADAAKGHTIDCHVANSIGYLDPSSPQWRTYIVDPTERSRITASITQDLREFGFPFAEKVGDLQGAIALWLARDPAVSAHAEFVAPLALVASGRRSEALNFARAALSGFRRDAEGKSGRSVTGRPGAYEAFIKFVNTHSEFDSNALNEAATSQRTTLD